MKNLAIFTILKKMMNFLEVTGGLPHGYVAEKPSPGTLAFGPEGTEKSQSSLDQ
ncbi:MAG: hypothetical protein R6T98_03535 [Desulfatiglandales bacterium]